MIRGIERREIFRDDTDRWGLVDRLARLVPLWGGDCFAWVLMGNHVHLVLRTGALPLAWLMRRLNTSVAIRFNQRHERVGYLFQNRFKSRLVEHQEDLLNLIRYVHLNPVRSGLVPDLTALERFPWSGHAALIGSRPAFVFESVDRVLALFDEDPVCARRRLQHWMALPIEDPQNTSTADANHMESRSPRTRGFETKGRAEPVERPLGVLVDSICRHFSVSSSELERGARNDRATRARAVLAFVLVVRRRLPISEVAPPLGVSPQAIGRAIERGAQLARQEEPYPRGWS